MRCLPWLGLVAIVSACNGAPPPSPAPSPTLIEPEPIASAHADGFPGCDFDPTPVVVITEKLMLLNGAPVDTLGLYAALDARQDLSALLKAPPRGELLLQVSKGVPERRVARALAAAERAGFVNITRLPDIDPLAKRSHSAAAIRR